MRWVTVLMVKIMLTFLLVYAVSYVLVILIGSYYGCQELDFLVEAKNSEKCVDNFRKLSPHIAHYVYAPMVYWNLTTSKLLTMEFIDGAQVNDVKTIQRLGIRPNEVARLVSSLNSFIDLELPFWISKWDSYIILELSFWICLMFLAF